MKNEAEVSRAIDLYADTVLRICFLHLKNHSDAEDVFQEVFLKYVLFERQFKNPDHEKAWIIRVTINACKDLLKSFFRQKVFSLETMSKEPYYIQEKDGELFDCILRLPHKYKVVIYLFYYEGYTAVEIAKIMGKKENTVYTWLNRARKELKSQLGGGPVE